MPIDPTHAHSPVYPHLDSIHSSQAAYQPSSSQPCPAAPAPTPAMSQTDAHGVFMMSQQPTQHASAASAPAMHPFAASAAGPQPVTLTIGSATLADGHEYVGSLCLFPKPKTGEVGRAMAGAAAGGGMALHY